MRPANVIALQMGCAEEALDCTTRPLKFAPSDHLALNAHGNAFMALSRAEKGLTKLSAACRLQAGYAKAFNNLGNALISLRCMSDTLGAYHQAWSLDAGGTDVELCRNLEAAFHTMWLRDERGEPPAAFSVPAP